MTGGISSSPAVCDLDLDGLSEVAAGTDGKVLYILDSDGGLLKNRASTGN